MGRLWRFLPWSRLAMAWWAWRNRRQLRQWAAFGLDAAPRVISGERRDVMAEARFRMAVARDPLTKAARNLRVRVVDGQATLSGRVPAAVRRSALDIARRTKGIDRVRDDLRAVPDRPSWFGRVRA